MNPVKRQISVTGAVALALSVGLSAPMAEAGQIYIESSFLPSFTQKNEAALGIRGGAFDNQPLNAESGPSLDLRNTLGYSFNFAPWLMIGGTYNWAKATMKREAVGSRTSLDRATVLSEFGPTLGIFLGRVRLIGTYIAGGSKSLNENAAFSDGTMASDEEIVNQVASGYQFTLGYSFPISTRLFIGPSVSYRHVSYGKQTYTNNVDPTQNYTDRDFTTNSIESGLSPMVSLLLRL